MLEEQLKELGKIDSDISTLLLILQVIVIACQQVVISLFPTRESCIHKILLQGHNFDIVVPVSPSGRIEPNEKALEPEQQKLGLYSRFVDPESRPIIAETQLAAAHSQGIGSREYELILVPSPQQKKSEEKK